MTVTTTDNSLIEDAFIIRQADSGKDVTMKKFVKKTLTTTDNNTVVVFENIAAA